MVIITVSRSASTSSGAVGGLIISDNKSECVASGANEDEPLVTGTTRAGSGSRVTAGRQADRRRNILCAHSGVILGDGATCVPVNMVTRLDLPEAARPPGRRGVGLHERSRRLSNTRHLAACLPAEHPEVNRLHFLVRRTEALGYLILPEVEGQLQVGQEVVGELRVHVQHLQDLVPLDGVQVAVAERPHVGARLPRLGEQVDHLAEDVVLT
ncbi:hypothetical protein EYF80_038800 [Liparis tanakae]|uniref:Uncharacterized protein n=1 Tax=Liparis tanakae TaxID=230148 RepID=A0A4Z2GBP0_9TELE|nr:hypothetical protein EYF80_038800 [Liparis tanakae]